VICISADKCHSRFVSKIKLKAPVVRFTRQDCLAWCTQRVCKNIMECRRGRSDFDVLSSNRSVGVEVLVDMSCECRWQTRTAGCAVGVSECCAWNGNLFLRSAAGH
jgi:hypothetical protein